MATIHMTEGKISRQLISYTLPLLLGNLFQLAYNAADSMIVGRFIGKEALAAVGGAAPITSLFILGISGISIGTLVLMSEFFGQKDYGRLREELATTMIFGFFFSLSLTLLGLFFAGEVLRLLQTPVEIFADAAVYLRLIFMGIPFTFFYNILSSALKSIGEVKAPLIFLVVSSVLNVLLDLFFIGLLGFGIAACALTTVFAEILCVALCFHYIRRKIPLLRISKTQLKVNPLLLKKTLQYGSITALQQATQPVGKVLIQGMINTMGVDVIAAFQAAGRMDDFAFLPEQNISHSITAFVAQNRGAGKKERINKGFLTGMALEFIYWTAICTATLLLRQPLMKLFVSSAHSPRVISLGSRYLFLMAFFYLFPALTNGFQGFFRGMGRMNITLAGTLIQTLLRVGFVYLLVPRFGLNGVAVACALGWGAMLMLQIPCWLKTRKTLRPDK